MKKSHVLLHDGKRYLVYGIQYITDCMYNSIQCILFGPVHKEWFFIFTFLNLNIITHPHNTPQKLWVGSVLLFGTRGTVTELRLEFTKLSEVVASHCESDEFPRH
jgi:hypothetical protein